MSVRDRRFANAGAALGVAALVGAMLADAAETAVDPANSGKAAQVYAAAAHHHGRMLASAGLLLASALLLMPGAFAVAQSLGSRGRRVGLAGCLAALLGGAGHIALATFYLAFAQVPKSGLSPVDGVAFIDHVTNSHESLLVAPLAIAFPIAILLTLIATVRGRLVGRWLLVPIVAAPVVGVVGPGSDAAKTCGALLLFLVAAVAVLRAAWAHPATAAPAVA